MSQSKVGIYASQISGHLWEPNGSYDALATVTVPSGGVASVTFAGIPQGYKHLQIRFIARANNANIYDSFVFRANFDTGNNYTFHSLNTDGSSLSSSAIANYGGFRGGELNGATATAGMFACGIVDLLDYSSTTKNKVAKMLTGNEKNGSGGLSLNSGVWMNTNAVTSITIIPVFGSAFSQDSQFALYGVK